MQTATETANSLVKNNANAKGSLNKHDCELSIGLPRNYASAMPAHKACYTLLIVVTFMDAGLLPNAGSSALKYRACAQNVSDVTSSVYIYGSWPTPG